MSNAILYRMPYGVAGDVTRPSNSTIEPQVLDSASAFPGYGLFGKISSAKFVPIGAADVATAIRGLLVRPFPTQGANASDPLGTAVPSTTGIANVLRRGWMAVKSNAGTPAIDGAVYIRVGNASGGKPIGGIEATAEVVVAGGVITGTGTGTIAATVAADAIVGTWALTLQTTSQTSKVTVIDPNGVRHPDATVGSAYSSGGLNFTITAAGTMTANDSFAPVVTGNTIKVPACTFAGSADADGNVEIAYNI
jgi:hypothetical protein